MFHCRMAAERSPFTEEGLKRTVLIEGMQRNGGGGADGGVAKLLPRLSLKSLSRISDDAASPGEQGGAN